jgi:ATP-dependent helicase/nuclease subunit A
MAAAPTPEEASSAALGTFVHALLARAHRRGITDEAGLVLLAEQLIRADGEADLAGATLARAVSTAAALLARDELGPRPGAIVVFEAPYSRRLDEGRVERGTIDCLIVEERSVLVLEFKTGVARVSHSAQLDAYVRAARAAYPDRHVEGRLLYGSEP